MISIVKGGGLIKIGILGSGASSVAAASLLTEYPKDKIEVSIIDFGQKTEAPVKIDPKYTHKNIANSLFLVPSIFSVKTVNTSIMGSSSFGGWAEGWGATIVPFSELFIERNSLNLQEFIDHKYKVLELLKGTGSTLETDRKRIVPNYIKILSDRNAHNCKSQFSSLAISTLNSDIELGCSQCGECLNGCPKNHIWKPSKSWPTILKEPNFNLISGVWIKSIHESGELIEVTVMDTNRIETKYEYNYIFCGLGAIQTGALLNRSGISKEVKIRDSQMVIVPFVDSRLKKTGSNTNRIALSELFLIDKQDSNNSVFCQIYGSSPSLKSVIVQNKKFLTWFPRKIMELFLDRIGVAMCFLDQENSGIINVALEDGASIISTKGARKKLFKQTYLVFRTLQKNGVIPLIFFTRLAPIGGGFHFGSSFPVSKLAKTENYSDLQGRPNGMNLLSIIDSSTLKSISSLPSTFNVMVKSQIIVKNTMKTFSL